MLKVFHPCWQLLCLILSAPVQAQHPAVALPPVPDLSALEAPIRESLQKTRERMATLLANPTNTAAVLAQEFGLLGELYLVHGLLNEAESALKNGLLLDPKEKRFAFYLALISEGKNQQREALNWFSRVLELDPNNLFARARLGHVRLALNEPEQARQAFQKALETASDEPYLLNGLGLAAAAMGEYRVAVSYFERVLARHPNASSVNQPLAQALLKLGEEEKARPYLLKSGQGKVPFNDPYWSRLEEHLCAARLEVALAMAAQTNTFSAPNFIDYISTHFRDQPGQIDLFLDAIDDLKFNQKNPNPVTLARLHYAVGSMFTGKQEYRDAIEQLEEAVRLAPNFIEPFLELGFVLRSQKKTGEAIDLYTSLLTRFPDHSGVLLDRASMYHELGRLPEAIADLEHLLVGQPKKKEALFALAIIYKENRNVTPGIATFEKLLAIDLEKAERIACLNGLALLLQDRAEHGLAARCYLESLQLNAAQPAVELNLATALSVQADYAAAIPHYRAVILVEPDNLAAWLGGIAALILSNQLPMARSILVEGIRNLPDNKTLTHLYARFLAASPDLSLRDGARALVLARSLFEPEENINFAETYAMAQAQAGRFDGAVRLQTELIKQVGSRVESTVLARLKGNLKRYSEGLACCADNSLTVLLP